MKKKSLGGRPEKFSVKKVAQAIREAKGIKSVAARRLGCSYMTLMRYVNKYPTVAKALEEAREELIDLAEGKLLERIQSGDMGAIKFFLQTQAKHRGYVVGQEVMHRGGEQLDVTVGVRLYQGIARRLVDILRTEGLEPSFEEEPGVEALAGSGEDETS